MKSITLKFGKETIKGQEVIFSTLNLLKTVLNGVDNQQGISSSEMQIRLKLLDRLKEHDEMDIKENVQNWHLDLIKEIQLEDKEYEYVKNIFLQTRWMTISKFISDLGQELEKN